MWVIILQIFLIAGVSLVITFPLWVVPLLNFFSKWIDKLYVRTREYIPLEETTLGKQYYEHILKTKPNNFTPWMAKRLSHHFIANLIRSGNYNQYAKEVERFKQGNESSFVRYHIFSFMSDRKKLISKIKKNWSSSQWENEE